LRTKFLTLICLVSNHGTRHLRTRHGTRYSYSRISTLMGRGVASISVSCTKPFPSPQGRFQKTESSSAHPSPAWLPP
jgi:hypothetical protein